MQLYQIGRGKENDIQLTDGSISRRHAQIVRLGPKELYIIDLNSTNGTFVNGVKIEGRYPLKKGNQVQLGSYWFDWEKQVHWEKDPIPESSASTKSSPSTQNPSKPPQKRPMLSGKMAYLGGGVVGLILLVIFYFAIVKAPGSGGGSSEQQAEQLEGKWTNQEDPQEWLQFGEAGTYEEGYGDRIVYPNASYEVREGNYLLLTKGQISVIYPFRISGDELILDRNSGPVSYER